MHAFRRGVRLNEKGKVGMEYYLIQAWWRHLCVCLE